MKIYSEGYEISKKICSIYIDIIKDYLLNNCSANKYQDRLRILRNLINIEDELYNKLTEDQVDKYIDYLYLDEIQDDKFIIDRYYRNLEERKISNHMMINENTSFNAFFDGTLIMYVIKKMYTTINESLKEKEFKNNKFPNNLMDYFISQMFFYLTTTKYSEKIALNCNFDVRRLPSFNKDIFSHIVESIFDDINELIIPFAIRDIDSIFSFYNKENDLIKVFSNLYNFFDLEALIMLLDTKGIMIINDYYSQKIAKINNIDKHPEISNIKRLIRKK